MRPLLRLPAGDPDWDAAIEYIETSIPMEQLANLAGWRVRDLHAQVPCPDLSDAGISRLRALLRDALEELRLAVWGMEPYRDMWSDAKRRPVDGGELLVGYSTHADGSITDIYAAIHHLHCAGVLEVLGCEREG